MLFANLLAIILILVFNPLGYNRLKNLHYPYVRIELHIIYNILIYVVLIICSAFFYRIIVRKTFHTYKYFSAILWMNLLFFILVNQSTTLFLMYPDSNLVMLVFSILYFNVCLIFDNKKRLILFLISYISYLIGTFKFHSFNDSEVQFDLFISFVIHVFFYLIGQIVYNIWNITVDKHLELKQKIKEEQAQKKLIKEIYQQQLQTIESLSDSLQITSDSEAIKTNPLLLATKINDLILELKTTQENLNSSNEKYKDIFENVSDGIIIRDETGKILIANKKVTEITGFNFNQTKNYYLEKIIKKKFLPEFSIFDEKLKSYREAHFEGEITTNRDKYDELVEIYSTPIIQNDTFLGSRDIIRVINDKQKHKQEIEKKAEAEKLFIVNMNHEIRTPLNAIIGMVELLKDSNLQDDQKEFISILDHSTFYLKNLITDIIDLSKIETGNIKLNEVECNLYTKNIKITNSFKREGENRNIKFITHIPEFFNRTLLFDSMIYTQIMNNLINNALKYTEKGIIEIILHPNIEVKEDKTFIKVSIKDSGIGIEEEYLEFIFEKFKQINSHNFSSLAGIGLGLSICKEILIQIGGEISVESKPNVGSTFTFLFPIQIK